MELARFFFTRLPLIGTFIVAQKKLLNLFTAASAWCEHPRRVSGVAGIIP
jgi:hypothetical protein